VSATLRLRARLSEETGVTGWAVMECSLMNLRVGYIRGHDRSVFGEGVGP
jgi:hypothetical protein